MSIAIVPLVLVDDHRVVAASLKAYLESFPEFRVVGIASSGEQPLQHIAEWKPRIILQDLLMPGGMDGTGEARMMGALEAGAAGYVRKDAEPEVLRRLALGLSNKEIASALSISEETVKSHIGNLYSKLQVDNRAQAVVQALKRSPIELDELA